VPYVPTPPEVVAKRLEMAEVRGGDLVYDLGCGDGRIVIAAAREFGDLFQSDFSDANVVTPYLLPDLNLRLRPQLWRQLQIGTRVVSHEFDMGDWRPQQAATVGARSVLRWTIDARIKAMVHRGEG
jgi:hypothetical protein